MFSRVGVIELWDGLQVERYGGVKSLEDKDLSSMDDTGGGLLNVILNYSKEE